MEKEVITTLDIIPGGGIRIKLGDTLLDVRSVETKRNNKAISSVDMEAVLDSLESTQASVVSASYTGNGDISVLFELTEESSEIILRTDGTWAFVRGEGGHDVRYKLYGNTED